MSRKTVNALGGTQFGWSLLLAGFIVIGGIWGGVLPWIAAQPEMQRHLTFLDERGIDPSAMFYTELDAMDAILKNVDPARDEIVNTKKPAE